MPAIVGTVNVNAIGASGVFNIGDVYNISPKSAVKTYAGAGSFVTGNNLKINNYHSVTNTNDNDVLDQNVTANI
ncbi:spore germination protein [Ammoniphilus sp. CFH 90114]|uniref:spore germination protein n=1 Tax=Ammoniphilus sp. CFH 90114 TaxID=2493665 RepID=UPI00100EA00E|nr:spore germination protein [Ammoniphilus sp. CFH 90114]RXT06285.1 spore germination protein [Ammoniphilus sp. CFH 90114]